MQITTVPATGSGGSFGRRYCEEKEDRLFYRNTQVKGDDFKKNWNLKRESNDDLSDEPL
ncbi:MAG: hypothetical protein V4725_02290 [Bacteroidota bacterium]